MSVQSLYKPWGPSLTVATASAPRPATKNISQTAKIDSMPISNIIGIASRKTARRMEPEV